MWLIRRGLRGERSRRRPGRDHARGSTLFMFPAAIVIVFGMGAVAIDLGNVWLQQRRLADAADSAANDAVTYAVDQDRYRADGSIVLDPTAVTQVVNVSVAGQDLPAGTSVQTPIIGSNGPNPTVEITITGRAEFIFGRFFSGGGMDISATGIAIATDQ